MYVCILTQLLKKRHKKISINLILSDIILYNIYYKVE